MVLVSWRKKAHSASSNRRSSPPKIRAQNLNDAWTSLKKGGNLPVLEVEQARQAATGGNRLEEPRRGLVGVYPRRREQPHEAVRLDEVHRPLDEQRVEVDVAAPQQRVVAGCPDKLAEAVRLVLRRVELVSEWVPALSESADTGAPLGRGRCQGQLRRASREPLHLLEL